MLGSAWRFHFGHATDVAQDFNFRGNFSKSGNLGPVGTLLFDDADWKAVDLRIEPLAGERGIVIAGSWNSLPPTPASASR